MKSILVTGASGFIGSNCIKHLLAAGYKIEAITSKASSSAFKNSEQLNWHQCDLLDKKAGRELLNVLKAETMLHLAWYAEPGKFWSSELNHSWLEASINLLEGFAASGGKRFVAAGSCAEYDWSDALMDEFKTPLNANTLYGKCKASFFERASRLSRERGLQFAWGRVFWLYGPGEDPRRIVAYVINSLLKNEAARCSPGAQIRDFMHVDDVARAFAEICAADICGPINIGSGRQISIHDLVEQIGFLIGKPELLQFGALSGNQDEAPLVLAKTARLESELGFSPRISLEEGLQDCIESWRSSMPV
ncbi:MAG: NAD(P)-dependent oxidoreductase [Candidatus Obscuribacterales bacterium]|nr:NAD(P)-dependent oxidoreductase [Candidatus Obscuribacterales bacterium]